jgi:hypothetical protein
MAKKNVKAKKDPQQIIKIAVNAVLIAFIIVSIGYAAFKATGGQKKTLEGPVAVVATPAAVNAGTEAAIAATAAEKAKVMLYYLHPTGRCSRCIAMEKYSQEAVEKYFSKQVGNGSLEFKSLNTDEPQNSHFVQDYQLVTKSLVITLVKGGKEQKYENLKGIWEHSGNQEAFHQYVKANVENYLKEAK